MLTKEDKTQIIGDHKVHPKDTGSSEVQVAIITNRINYLTEHLKIHKHDHHTKNGLMKLVGQRKRLLEYLKKQDQKRYENLIKKLNIRK